MKTTQSSTMEAARVLGLVLSVIVLLALPRITQAADPLIVTDMDGVQHDLDTVLATGERVALVFWQTWCPTCKREAPALAKAVRAQSGAVQFFGVVSGPDSSVDDDKVRRVAREWHHEHAQIRDRDLALTQRFRVRGTPVIIVLGEGQKVLYRGYRLPKSWAPYLANVRGTEATSGPLAPPSS